MIKLRSATNQTYRHDFELSKISAKIACFFIVILLLGGSGCKPASGNNNLDIYIVLS